jgi:hypothetical protein
MLPCSNRTYAFAALLQLLREPPPGVPVEALPKFYDLVVKCLIKLTKGLQGGMQARAAAGPPAARSVAARTRRQPACPPFPPPHTHTHTHTTACPPPHTHTPTT